MSLTPMMQQYRDAKAEAPDALLLFRMGDFYELFFEDAETAARVLGLALTTRDKGPNAVPMAGFPYHALETQLRKLLESGLRVAVCEQIEDPKRAVGLVKRAVTRVITPGTLTDETLLDPKQPNYLAAIVPAAGRKAKKTGLAWLDILKGQLLVAALDQHEVAEELARLEPSECILPEDQLCPDEWLLRLDRVTITRRPAWEFSSANAVDLLQRHFQVKTFSGFGIDDDSDGIVAAGALLAYLYATQKTGLNHVSRMAPYHVGAHMILDVVTRRSLELVRTMRENRRDGTLLATIDSTTTAAGARTLRDWVMQPLVDVEAIRYRQAAVAEWKDDPQARGELRDLLSKTSDVERLSSRISANRCTPRDLAALRQTLRGLPDIKAKLAGRRAAFNADLEENIELLPELRDRLERMLEDDPPLVVRDGGIIRRGVSAELDELAAIASGGKQWMANFQRDEAERSGIPNLKVGFNKVFGFYIEVPNSGRSKVPEYFQREQTLKNAERYITPELKEYEQKVLGAEERAAAIEYDLFAELREYVASFTGPLQKLAAVIAHLDVVLGLAETAFKLRYVRPEVVDGPELFIEGGRHPVLDATLAAGRFVPNDTKLSAKDGVFLLITGPNMAGKSTYIRQVALITLMAQIGSFVPADRAAIGVADRVFTRVGASDELSRGQSTFMVEMTETANILNNATERSLVILDEIGRGTSTYDGVSLAWAIAEHLHDGARCRTLFATHYHELIQLEETLSSLRNANIAVREWQEEIIFLHQIVFGGADRSYGIHVARLAGVPTAVLKRAQFILERLEQDPFGKHAGERVNAPKKHRRAYHQLSLFPLATAHPVLDALRTIDADAISPDEAVALIRKWRNDLDHEDEGERPA